jgi:transposase
MDEQTSSRPGVAGLDIFKIAGQSISGFLPSWKTGDHSLTRQPYMSLLEARLALHLEYHPHVRIFQRGDVSEAFARARRLKTPLGAPYRIGYVYDGKAHDYLPDFVGTLIDGSLLIAEAGREDEKRKAQALAKAEAAHRLAQLKGGVYWLGTDQNLSLIRHNNLLYLHARRRPFQTYEEIALVILAHWPYGDVRSVDELISLLGSRWSDVEVEATVWKLVADAMAEGRLLVDLAERDLSLSTPLALLEPGSVPILPDPLPSSLEETRGRDEASALPSHKSEEMVSQIEGVIPGPTFDASVLETKDAQAHFHRNLAAVSAVLLGRGVREVAKESKIAPSTLSRLVERSKKFGQIACVPHRTYQRDRTLMHPELQQLVRKLYTHPMRPTIMAVYEDVRLRRLVEELSERQGTPVKAPTYRQVQHFLKGIEHQTPVVEARSGLKHPPRERMSTESFVLSIAYPAHICQVDEHTLDQLVVTPDGTVITRRVHGAVLICVKTAAILGAVLSLDSLKEEDYMRLVKMSLEAKDRLTTLYECKHPWSCSGKPAVIFHDRGKIFTSERATQVLVDRLGIATEQAPAYAPSAKGTVEALFTWTTRKFEHRLPGTTKATLKDRGAYDSQSSAEQAGITLDVLEKFFIQAIVDGYMQEWNTLRRQTPSALWEASVREKGISRWMGSQDDLKLLLMKAVNRKNPATGRYAITQSKLSFLGRSYVSPGLLDRLRGREIDIYYDRRDISVIYLFLEGELVGEAYATALFGQRMSIWEADAGRKADAGKRQQAAEVSRSNRQSIQEEALSGRKLLSLETKRLERKRQLDQQRSEMHPEAVQATLQALKAQQNPAVPAPGKNAGFLPPAIPEDDPKDSDLAPLPVRTLGRDDD